MILRKFWPNLATPRLLPFVFILLTLPSLTRAQHSVAYQWSEVLLEAIRKDFARPTVHARNLFHTSTVMYDAWAAYTPDSDPYFLGDTLAGFVCPFTGVPIPANVKAAQEEAMSYAAYRLLKHRFQGSPGSAISLPLMDTLFARLGYDPSITSTQYATGGPAELGNYLASQMIAFGLQDGANEANDYANQYYTQRNFNLAPAIPGNPFVIDINLWQPLTFQIFIDQSGNQFPGGAPPFLSPEWGNVVPFAMQDSQMTTHVRRGRTYKMYEDPGAPAFLDSTLSPNNTDEYLWGHTLVGIWSSHLDPADTVMWDISPKSIGNIQNYPTTIAGLRSFYKLYEGGDNSIGHSINPRTGQPYAPQIVSRGDYARVLAEFWADGPDSETPPGHWFTILNYVMDHPLFERRWMGEGPLIDDLEWDVKAYLTMGGAVHDAAVAAWSIKGWYDYSRPISALRYMSELGQSSDPSLSNYHPYGIPLHPGYIESVTIGDPLAGVGNQDVGEIKIRAWKGPDYINDPTVDTAGVDWILLKNWWPYQRPTFVTPPFAGYVSGHSTFSRAAAEVMTMITGDAYFPGGMGEFHAKKDSFLVFEVGPGHDVTLQWATYRDASDQCSLSRIWGGIHPPVDDIPGRLIGMRLGPQAVNHAQTYFDPDGKVDVVSVKVNVDTLTDQHVGAASFNIEIAFERNMDTTAQPTILFPVENPETNTLTLNPMSSYWSNAYTFVAAYDVANSSEVLDSIDVRIEAGLDKNGKAQEPFDVPDLFFIETENPTVPTVTANTQMLAIPTIGPAAFQLTLTFSETMDTTVRPMISFPVEDPLATSMALNPGHTFWIDSVTFQATYDLLASSAENLPDIDIRITGARDLVKNVLDQPDLVDFFTIDTKKPDVATVTPNINVIADVHAGTGTFVLSFQFSEKMDQTQTPVVSFPVENPLMFTLTANPMTSGWKTDSVYEAKFDVANSFEILPDIDVQLTGAFDAAQNAGDAFIQADLFDIFTQNPTIISLTPTLLNIADQDVGIANFRLTAAFSQEMDVSMTPSFTFPVEDPLAQTLTANTDSSGWLDPFTYQVAYDVADANETLDSIDVMVSLAQDKYLNLMSVMNAPDWFHIDTENPVVVSVTPNHSLVSDAVVGTGTFALMFDFSEEMDITQAPVVSFPVEDPLAMTLTPNATASGWLSATRYEARYDVANSGEVLNNIDVRLSGLVDVAQNAMSTFDQPDLFDIETQNPEALFLISSLTQIADPDTGTSTFRLTAFFSEVMDTMSVPSFLFPVEDPLAQSLTLNGATSGWVNTFIYEAFYDVANANETLDSIDVQVMNALDIAQNPMETYDAPDLFHIDTENPLVTAVTPSTVVIADMEAGTGTFWLQVDFSEEMDISQLPVISFPVEDPLAMTLTPNAGANGWQSTTRYTARYDVADAGEVLNDIDVRIAGAFDANQNQLEDVDQPDLFHIEMENPAVVSLTPSLTQIADQDTGTATFRLTVAFSEDMDTLSVPTFSFPVEDPLAQSLSLNTGSGNWVNAFTYEAVYDVANANETLTAIDVEVQSAKDAAENVIPAFQSPDLFHIDTENPIVVSVLPNVDTVKLSHIGTATFELRFAFSEAMDQAGMPSVGFPVENPLAKVLTLNTDSSQWLDATTYAARYDVADSVETLLDIDLDLSMGMDLVQNELVSFTEADVFHISILDTTTSTGLFPNLAAANALMKAYPNPISEGQSLVVEPGFWEPVLQWQLFNAKGQLVASESIRMAADQDDFKVDVQGHAAGIYLLRVIGGEQQGVVRIVKGE